MRNQELQLLRNPVLNHLSSKGVTSARGHQGARNDWVFLVMTVPFCSDRCLRSKTRSVPAPRAPFVASFPTHGLFIPHSTETCTPKRHSRRFSWRVGAERRKGAASDSLHETLDRSTAPAARPPEEHLDDLALAVLSRGHLFEALGL